MSKFTLINASCAEQNVDVVVNAANRYLASGAGICYVIFKNAGEMELTKACSKYNTPLKDGEAVITPAFNIKNAKAIIHAVGPDFRETPNAIRELYYAYFNSMVVLRDNGYHSISFPLISSSIFGGNRPNKVEESTKQCLRAYRKFVSEYPDYEIYVILCAYTADEMIKAKKEYDSWNVSENIENDAVNNAKTETNPIVTKRDSDQVLHMGDITYTAVYFHRPDEPDGFLSNWYKSPFVLDGIKFSSSEQYIMYQKCKIFCDMASANKILTTDDPQTQQDIGRKASGYISKVWEGVRQQVAIRGLMAKFSQNEDLKKKLLDTGDAYLVECAGSDKIWACGIRLNDDNRFYADRWDGSNILGFALMEVRERLKNSIKSDTVAELNEMFVEEP